MYKMSESKNYQIQNKLQKYPQKIEFKSPLLEVTWLNLDAM